jgi:glutamine amidotransferase-like uncharacterized protein
MMCSAITNERHLQLCLEEIVREVNSSNITIYSYTGNEKHEPIYYEETELFKKMVARANLKWPIVEVSDAEFNPLTWDPQHVLLHIPGAISTELDHHLGSKVEEIQKFVMRGGKFLGWCGGGYWACRQVRYIDALCTIHKERTLALWNGVEEGPLLPFLGNPEGNIGFFHGAVKVKWNGSEILKKHLPQGLELNVLLSGGGTFIPAQEEHRYKVLAAYGDYEEGKNFAGVKTCVGEGIAILINPYFTHGPDYLRSGLDGYERYFPSHPWARIVQGLEGSELKSLICFADMLLEATRKLDDAQVVGKSADAVLHKV